MAADEVQRGALDSSLGRIVEALVKHLGALSATLVGALERCGCGGGLCDGCQAALQTMDTVRADLTTVRALYQMRN